MWPDGRSNTVSGDARSLREPPKDWQPSVSSDKAAWFAGSSDTLIGDEGGQVLIVDDLVDTGKTAGVVRGILPQAHFATVYAKPAGRPLVDTFVTEVSQDTWIYLPWDMSLQFTPPIRDGAGRHGASSIRDTARGAARTAPRALRDRRGRRRRVDGDRRQGQGGFVAAGVHRPRDAAVNSSASRAFPFSPARRDTTQYPLHHGQS